MTTQTPTDSPSLAALMGVGVLHVCYVTRDLKAAVKDWQDDFGWGSFTMLGAIETMGNKCEVAFGAHGDLFVELIEPRDDQYLYNTLLDAAPADAKSAFHHYAVRVEDVKSAQAAVHADGHELTAHGYLSDDFWFGYIDLTKSLGHFVELVWASKNGEAFWAEIKAGSADARL